jgi:amino acid transporter
MHRMVRHVTVAEFIPPCSDIPLVLGAYLTWKFVKKTKTVSLDSIPLGDALEQAEQYPDEPEAKQEGWLRCVSWLWD